MFEAQSEIQEASDVVVFDGNDGGSIQAYAARALKEAANDWDKARKLLIEWADTNLELAGQLMEVGAHHVIWNRARRRRSRIFKARDHKPIESPKDVNVDDTCGLKAMAVSNVETLYDYPLAGGKRLGDATILDLEGEVATLGTNATSMLIKCKFLGGALRLFKQRTKSDNAQLSEYVKLEELEAQRAEARKTKIP